MGWRGSGLAAVVIAALGCERPPIPLPTPPPLPSSSQSSGQASQPGAALSGTWQDMARIGLPGPGSDSGARVAVAATGDALVVFRNDAGVWAQRYEKASGAFTPAVRLSQEGSGETISPLVAMNAAGDATVSWVATVAGDQRSVFARRFSVSGGWPGGWAAPEAVATENRISLGSLTMTRSGHAAVSWIAGAALGRIAVSEAGGGWGDPVPFETGDTMVLTIASAATETGQGLRVVVAGMARTAASHDYVAGGVYQHDLGSHAGSFEAPRAIAGARDGGPDQEATSVEVDDAGNAFVGVYELVPGGSSAEGAGFPIGKTYVVRHTGAWNDAEQVFDGPQAAAPSLAVSGDGEALIVASGCSAGGCGIWTRRFSGGGWRSPILTPSAPPGSAFTSWSIALDGRGAAFALCGVWMAAAPASVVAATRIDPFVDWSAGQLWIVEPAGISLEWPMALAVGPNGPAVAVWTSVEGPGTTRALNAAVYR